MASNADDRRAAGQARLATAGGRARRNGPAPGDTPFGVADDQSPDLAKPCSPTSLAESRRACGTPLQLAFGFTLVLT